MSLEIAEDVQAHCTMVRQFTYHLVWRPVRDYVPGAQVELRSGRLRSFHTWTFMRMEAGPNADVTWRWKVRPTAGERWANRERVRLRARLPYGVKRGESVSFHLTAVPGTFAGVDETLSVWTIDVPNNFAPADDIPAVREEGSECVLTLVAGPVERLEVWSRPMALADGTVRTCVVPTDRFGNPARFEADVPLTLTWNGASQEHPLRETLILDLPAPDAPVGRAVAAVPMSALAPRENVANGRREDGRLTVTGNPVWRDAPQGLRPAFGEFHWHTEFSGDGQRPIDEALRCARDELNMDFTAPGDHNPRGEAWDATVGAIEAADEPDRFATLFGWEMGSDRGHENYYFTDPHHPMVCGGAAGVSHGRPGEHEHILQAQSDFIAIPHHTNAVAETRKVEDDSPMWHPYPWGEPAPFRRLIEIIQGRGNQEREVYGDAWCGWHQNNGSSAQAALAMGHRLGFTGGTDNHAGWPGRAFSSAEGPGRQPPHTVILTGLWTPRIERQDVFDSLFARRTWVAWNTRAIVWFTVNNVPAGGELSVAAGEELTADLRLSACDALQTAEIVSDGQTVWQESFDSRDVEIDAPLGAADRDTHFYFRALQRDGGIIYASPVFVTLET